MSNRDRFLTRWLTTAPDWLFASYAIATSFSTYFCMYAFRKLGGVVRSTATACKSWELHSTVIEEFGVIEIQ